jgi:hypothetical protein
MHDIVLFGSVPRITYDLRLRRVSIQISANARQSRISKMNDVQCGATDFRQVGTPEGLAFGV